MSSISIDIRKGDITRVKTAAIVNAANRGGAVGRRANPLDNRLTPWHHSGWLRRCFVARWARVPVV